MRPLSQGPEKAQLIRQTIFDALDEVSAALPDEQEIERSDETILIGASGVIDSLKLTMLIVSIEQKIEDAFGVTITLVDSNTLSPETSPFRQVRLLVQYIEDLLKAKIDG